MQGQSVRWLGDSVTIFSSENSSRSVSSHTVDLALPCEEGEGRAGLQTTPGQR